MIFFNNRARALDFPPAPVPPFCFSIYTPPPLFFGFHFSILFVEFYQFSPLQKRILEVSSFALVLVTSRRFEVAGLQCLTFNGWMYTRARVVGCFLLFKRLLILMVWYFFGDFSGFALEFFWIFWNFLFFLLVWCFWCIWFFWFFDVFWCFFGFFYDFFSGVLNWFYSPKRVYSFAILLQFIFFCIYWLASMRWPVKVTAWGLRLQVWYLTGYAKV